MNTFKRTVAVVLSVLMLLSVFTVAAVSASADTTDMIYFVPSSNWKNDDARFAVHPYHPTEGYAWEYMTDENGDGIYEAVMPEGNWTNVIFVRMNPEIAELDWSAKWNQSAEFALDGTNNCLTLNEGEWDGAQGTWSVVTTEVPTEPSTQNPDFPVEEGKVIIRTSTNNTELANADCDTTKIESIVVTFNLQTDVKLVNCEGILNYDSNALELVSFEMPNISGAVYNTNLFNMVKFNASNVQSLYDFTTAKEFCVATFKAKADCNTAVSLDFVELNATSENDVPLVTNGEVVGTFKADAVITFNEIPTESSSATESTTTQPTTQPATKAPALKVAKTSLKAGQTTTASVSNKNGKTVTYSTSNKKIAKIDAKSGKITALQKGTIKVCAKVGTKKLYKTVKVTTSPSVKYKNKTFKSGKTITLKKGKTATLTITGKASKINNNVSVKSKKYVKVTSKKTQSKVTFKALKKGKTTITIKVNGVKSFKYTIRVK